jgi:hypothetical protein
MSEKPNTLDYETADRMTHKPVVSWRLLGFAVMCGVFSSIALDIALPAWNVLMLRFIFVLFVGWATMLGIVCGCIAVALENVELLRFPVKRYQYRRFCFNCFGRAM